MASIRAACCCGSSLEAHSLIHEPRITQEWYSLHARCVIAWQKQRGVDTRLVKKDED